jgi:hypothetical protein
LNYKIYAVEDANAEMTKYRKTGSELSVVSQVTCGVQIACEQGGKCP